LLNKTGVVKHRKAVSFSICLCSVLTCGHEYWVMTEIIPPSTSGRDGIFAKSSGHDTKYTAWNS